MLNYRVSIKSIDKTRATIPVTSVKFTDFNEIYDEENSKNIEPDGTYHNKIMVTCECDDVDELNNGDVINAVNILPLSYKTYTFNNEFTITGVNKENRSFSFIIDKYYVLNPSSIIKSADTGIPEYFEGYTGYLSGISLILQEPHYYDNTQFLETVYTNGADIITKEQYDELDEENKIFFYEDSMQKIPIHFRYVGESGEVKDVTVNFKYFSSDILATDLAAFKENEDTIEIYKLIFGINDIDEEVESDITGNLSGVEIVRENFLFSAFANYYFENEKPVVNIPIPFSNSFETNLYQSDLLQEYFIDEEKKKVINNIVDMEKDVYYPVVKTSDNTLVDIQSIKFNLHFREHRGENWLIDGNCYWNGVHKNDKNKLIVDEVLTNDNASDLLCFLGFTNNDIRFQKNKLKKSFLRLSFYDSTNPANQNLVGYSTIFLDGGNLFSKYVKYFDTEGYMLVNYDIDKFGEYDTSNKNDKVIGNRVDRERNFNEEYRLSSQFTIKGKNTSSSSSEGFYVYLWKDNSSGLPQDIYMKVEFNHAGYGRTIPFMMPYWDRKKWVGTYVNKNDNTDVITQEEYEELSENEKEKYNKLTEKKVGIKTFDEIITDWRSIKKTDYNGNVSWLYQSDGKDVYVDGHYNIRQYLKFSYIHFKYQYDKDGDKYVYYLDNETYGDDTVNKNFFKKDGDEAAITINLYEAKVE